MLPEERLWVAVLHRTLRDIVSEIPRIRGEATAYLTRQTKDLRIVCDHAGVSIKKVIQAAEYLQEIPPQQGVIYLDKLMKDYEQAYQETTGEEEDADQ